MTDQDGKPTTGGCQCGAIRYSIAGPVDESNICHCRMCQKAGGGPFMVFVNVSSEALTWTRGRPAVFASSTLAARGFCADCGTPLTYQRRPAAISIAHGTLDDPARWPPQSRLGSETVLPWSEHVGTLPIQTTSDWLASLGPTAVINHQHPDRDR